MRYKIHFQNRFRLLVVKTDGRMNAVDYIAMAEAILRHPRFVRSGNAVFDHRVLKFSDVTLEELEQIRAFHHSHEDEIGGGKTAIVVAEGLAPAWDELWSQGEKLKTANKVRIFEDYQAAVAWVK